MGKHPCPDSSPTRKLRTNFKTGSGEQSSDIDVTHELNDKYEMSPRDRDNKEVELKNYTLSFK